MADYKYTEIPPFTKREGDALLFNQEGYLEYYIPKDYFGSKSATIEGAYIRLMGSFHYRIYSSTGKPGKLMTFNYPTIFICRPGKVDKPKKLKLDDGFAIRIYNVERTICDIIRDRNKIDLQIFNTAINEYMKRKDKNLILLSEYATKFKIEKILAQYMEVLG